jgi:hypothetical protein
MKVNTWFPVFTEGVRVMVFKFSVISWQSVLLVEETRVPGETHRPAASHWPTLSHNVLSSTPRLRVGFELTTLVLIGTDMTKGKIWFLGLTKDTWVSVSEMKINMINKNKFWFDCG